MTTFFADTNFFLQCQNAESLPWGDVTEDTEVTIIIPMAVQKEFDRLKQDGNGRRARRARLLTPLFREMLSSDELEKTIRTASREIIIKLAPPPSRPINIDHQLDLAQADDFILAEIHAYNNDFFNKKASLLTNDINMMVKARHYQIPYVQIPDTWLLQPEPDERDKKVKELEQRVAVLEKTQPNAFIQAVSSDNTVLSHCEFEIVNYEVLSDSFIDSMLEEVRLRLPMVTVFSKPSFLEIGRQYTPPPQEEINIYQNEKYPVWLEEVESYIRKLPNLLEALSRIVDVRFSLTNDGLRPAENLIVEFETVGNIQFQLLPDDETKTQLSGFPKPPKAPEGKVKSFMGLGFKDISEIMGPPFNPRFFQPGSTNKQNRYEFYWKDGKPNPIDSIWAYTCDEFRHRLDAEPFDLTVLLQDKFDPKCSNAIRYRVSASNQSHPCVGSLPFSIKQVRKNPEGDVRSALQKIIKSLLQE